MFRENFIFGASTIADRAKDEAIARFRAVAKQSLPMAGSEAVDFGFKRGRIFRAPNKGVSEIRDAIVLSGEWFVLSNDFVLCDAFTQTPIPPLSAYLVGIPRPDYIDLLVPAPISLGVSESFLLGGCPNYSHWLMDYLPRLQLWRRGIPLLVNGGMRSFQFESLQALGIGPDALIELSYPNAYHLPSVSFPSLQSYWGSMPPLSFQPDIIQWLRTKFAPLFAVGAERRRIFITREGESRAASRRLLNGEEIVDVARKYDFEIVACESLSFAEQVKIFSQASVIVGAHGAGLVNLIFAPAQARIIELIGPRGADPVTERSGYRELAGFMNMEFDRVVGQSDIGLPLENNHLVNELFSIDPTEFTAVLNRR